jgi:hypothetical protein
MIAVAIDKYLNMVKESLTLDQLQKGMKASGQSASTLRVEVSGHEGNLFGAHYIKYQITGRGPGGFPPIDKIVTWLQYKGQTVSGSIRSVAFLIARKIANEGTDIYQGKRPGLDLKGAAAKHLPELKRDIAHSAVVDLIEKIRSTR